MVILGLGLLFLSTIWFTSKGVVTCVHGDGADAAAPCPDISDRDGQALSARDRAAVDRDRRWKSIFAPVALVIGLACVGMGLRMAWEQEVLTPGQARRARERARLERDAIGHSPYADEIAKAAKAPPPGRKRTFGR